MPGETIARELGKERGAANFFHVRSALISFSTISVPGTGWSGNAPCHDVIIALVNPLSIFSKDLDGISVPLLCVLLVRLQILLGDKPFEAN